MGQKYCYAPYKCSASAKLEEFGLRCGLASPPLQLQQHPWNHRASACRSRVDVAAGGQGDELFASVSTLCALCKIAFQVFRFGFFKADTKSTAVLRPNPHYEMFHISGVTIGQSVSVTASCFWVLQVHLDPCPQNIVKSPRHLCAVFSSSECHHFAIFMLNDTGLISS